MWDHGWEWLGKNVYSCNDCCKDILGENSFGGNIRFSFNSR